VAQRRSASDGRVRRIRESSPPRLMIGRLT
jgi:hypothetical protein